MTMKGSSTIVRLIALGIAIVAALALGLGLGLGLKKDSTAENVPTYTLASNVQLDGLTSSSFTDEPKLAFRTGMATTLDVEVSAITITSVEDVVARRRRSLLAAGLKVNFEVEIAPAAGDTTDSITTVVAAVTTKVTTTPLATIVTNLQTAFDAVVTSNAVVIVVTATPPAPAVKTTVVVNGVTTTKTVCGTNERVSSGVCVACASTQSNKAGDDPSGADTLCDTIAPPPPPPSPPPPSGLCIANQHVSSGSCVECAPGTRRNAGDDPSRGSTTCLAVKCGVSQYVDDHSCSSCPTGYTNADVTATDCTLCAANYIVSSGKCVACESGTTNDAGDDTKGEDTECDVEGVSAGDTSDIEE